MFLLHMGPALLRDLKIRQDLPDLAILFQDLPTGHIGTRRSGVWIPVTRKHLLNVGLLEGPG